MNVHELALSVEGLDEAAFVARFPVPVLVFLTETARLDDTPAHDTVRPMTLAELSRQYSFKMTDPIPTPGTSPTATGGRHPEKPLAITPSSTVFFLEKSDRNVFGSMITLGRSTNNDVVIPLGTVSKMHAYFTKATGPVWRITDQHSANGTFVSGLKLPNGQATDLKGGDQIGFGSEAQCRFLLPHGIFKVIEAYRPHVVRDDPPG